MPCRLVAVSRVLSKQRASGCPSLCISSSSCRPCDTKTLSRCGFTCITRSACCLLLTRENDFDAVVEAGSDGVFADDVLLQGASVVGRGVERPGHAKRNVVAATLNTPSTVPLSMRVGGESSLGIQPPYIEGIHTHHILHAVCVSADLTRNTCKFH